MIVALLIVLAELAVLAALGFRAILRKGDERARLDADLHEIGDRWLAAVDRLARAENRARCREFGISYVDHRPGLGWMAARPLGPSAPELVRFASCEAEAVWLIQSGRV